eukprot:362009-Chlamydomonas_euryale.AAC.20
MQRRKLSSSKCTAAANVARPSAPRLRPTHRIGCIFAWKSSGPPGRLTRWLAPSPPSPTIPHPTIAKSRRVRVS